MFTIAIIAFREFFEAFLIVGMFLGVSRKLKLKKEFEICVAAVIGVVISLVLSGTTYLLGDSARSILTESRAELLSNYLLLFSGFFLAYVVYSLHNRISQNKKEIIQKVTTKLGEKTFDITLFATIIFLVSREGFEVALFTASASLFNVFIQNFFGLLIGFSLSLVLGTSAFLAYSKFPIKKVFKLTEYMIVILGASMVQIGITELLDHQFNIHLGQIVSLGMNFLPNEHSILGNFIRTFTGVDREFSLARLSIMVVYGLIVYFIFHYKKINTYEK